MMSESEAIGLTVEYAPCLAASNPRGTTGSLTPTLNSVVHEYDAFGGYHSATYNISQPQLDLEDWIEFGLGLDIKAYDETAEMVWEGFVNVVHARVASATVTIGPLINIMNRGRVIFTERDTTVTPPALAPGQSIAVANNTASQAKYGIWYKWESVGERSVAEAIEALNQFLVDRAEPARSEILSLRGGGDLSLTLECLGYCHWLKAYQHADAMSGTRLAELIVQDILASDPNSIFSTDYSQIDANGLTPSRYEASDTDAWTLMQAVVSLGDANDDRWTFGIYQNRRAYYKQAPQEVSYFHRLSDPGQRLEFAGGALCRPWQVLPAKWLFTPDFLSGAGFPRVQDWPLDPRFMFIENVKYLSPYDVEMTGTRQGKIDQVVAKLGLGGVAG